MLNGPGHLDERRRYVGNMNMSFAYVEGESLIMGLKVRAYWAINCEALLLPATPACNISCKWVLVLVHLTKFPTTGAALLICLASKCQAEHSAHS